MTGEITGYSLAAPGDTDREGELIFYGGSILGPDLSLNRRPDADSSWRHADTELRIPYAPRYLRPR